MCRDNKLVRCADTCQDVKNMYHKCISSKDLSMMKSNIPLQINDDQYITINIPIVFHLLDPILSRHTVEFWQDHIIKNIIPQLNEDFNICYRKSSAQYIKIVTDLFKNADKDKLKYYLQQVDMLPNFINLNWKIMLDKIIIKPVGGLVINIYNNDLIYRSAQLVDPEYHINIIVTPGSNVLGMSVYPFVDRNSNDESLIDIDCKYRNAILINTIAFIGIIKPFDKYRTFTHEIGHWCGLFHTFDNVIYKSTDVIKFGINDLEFDNKPVEPWSQDQNKVGDLVVDTAIQSSPVFGKVYDNLIKIKQYIDHHYVDVEVRDTPYAMIFEKNHDTPNFYNFMDYTDDDQMYLYTKDQMLHMIYMLRRFRPQFIKIY